MTKSSIATILPAFNEEISIGSIVLCTSQHADLVLVRNDGSTDGTIEVAKLDDLQNRFVIFQNMR